MLTVYSGTESNQWSFDIESTRFQGTKTSFVSEAWLCVGNSRGMRWSTKECWSELTELLTDDFFLTSGCILCFFFFLSEFHTGHDSIHLIISHTNNLSKEYFASHWVTTIYEHPNHFYQPSLLAPHHHIMDGPPRGKRFYLLGFPIAKSTAPAFHNHCFQSWHTGTPNTFETWSSSKVIDDLLRVCFQEEFGGAAWVLFILLLLFRVSDWRRLKKLGETTPASYNLASRIISREQSDRNV